MKDLQRHGCGLPVVAAFQLRDDALNMRDELFDAIRHLAGPYVLGSPGSHDTEHP